MQTFVQAIQSARHTGKDPILMFSIRLGVLLSFCFLFGAVVLLAQDSAQSQRLITQGRQAPPQQSIMRRENNREEVKLDKPARLRLEPVDGDQLGRGGAMRTRVVLEGAPMPINMFSFAVEYTTDTLRFTRQLRAAEGYLVTVAPPRPGPDGMDILFISGIAIEGIKDGELLMLEFQVAEEGERAKMRIVDHPMLNEKLAHDDERTTFEYERVLDSSAVRNLRLVERSELPAAAQQQPMPRRSVRRGS